MRKNTVKWLLTGNILAIIGFFILLMYENNRCLTGLAALESVGRFVIYLTILVVLTICLLIQIIYILRRKGNSKRDGR